MVTPLVDANHIAGDLSQDGISYVTKNLNQHIPQCECDHSKRWREHQQTVHVVSRGGVVQGDEDAGELFKKGGGWLGGWLAGWGGWGGSLFRGGHNVPWSCRTHNTTHDTLSRAVRAQF